MALARLASRRMKPRSSKRRDQPMDAGLRPQVERVLHLIEGGRHAALLQALVDEAQKLELLAGQHRCSSRLGPARSISSDRSETNHERTLSVRYVFRKHLIWSEKVEGPLKAELKDDAEVNRRPPRLRAAPESPGSRPAPKAPSGNCPARERRRHRSPLGSPSASRASSRRARRWRAGRGRAERSRAPARGRRGRQSRRISGTRNRKAQTKDDTGLPGTPSTCIAPSCPCIIGRPGRNATRQNDRSRPSAASARCTRSWSPTEAPPLVTQDVGAGGRGRCARRQPMSSMRSWAMPRSMISAPSRSRHGEQGEAVGIDDLARRRARCRAEPVRRRCRAPRPWAADAPAARG